MIDDLGPADAVADVKIEHKADNPRAVLPSDALSIASTRRPSHLLVTARGTKHRAAGSLPPRLMCTPRVQHVFRFVSTGGSLLSVTCTELLGACGTICTVANTTVSQLASSVRIKSITVWPSASATSPQNCTLQWATQATDQTPDELVDLSIPEGVLLTRALVFRPPARSLAGYWNSSVISSTTLLSAAIPIGSVLDLSVEFTVANVFAQLSQSVAAGVLGAIYYLALDGPASNKWTPVGVPTTH
jgi:hypothetical protein